MGTSLWKSVGFLSLLKSLSFPKGFDLLFVISFKSEPWNSDFQKQWAFS
jgi:hypothetical protein